MSADDSGAIERDPRWYKLRDIDLNLIERILLGLRVRRPQREKLMASAKSYEMSIKGYDFVLSIISSSLRSPETDFYWMEGGFTLHRRKNTFNWHSFVTHNALGSRIRNTNNLMPDRHAIKHDDIHQFCKDLENMLRVLVKIENNKERRGEDRKRLHLAELIRCIKPQLGKSEATIIDHFREFRNTISHDPDRIEDSPYRGVPLRDCYRNRVSTPGERFSFLSDMFKLTEKLIKLFRSKQAMQISRDAILNRLSLIERFSLFRGQYILSADWNRHEATPSPKRKMHIQRTRRGEQPKFLRSDFSVNHIGFWLSDGRFVSVPIDWYPELKAARPEDLSGWRVIDNGMTIAWPSLKQQVRLTDVLQESAGS